MGRRRALPRPARSVSSFASPAQAARRPLQAGEFRERPRKQGVWPGGPSPPTPSPGPRLSSPRRPTPPPAPPALATLTPRAWGPLRLSSGPTHVLPRSPRGGRGGRDDSSVRRGQGVADPSRGRPRGRGRGRGRGALRHSALSGPSARSGSARLALGVPTRRAAQRRGGRAGRDRGRGRRRRQRRRRARLAPTHFRGAWPANACLGPLPARPSLARAPRLGPSRRAWTPAWGAPPLGRLGLPLSHGSGLTTPGIPAQLLPWGASF